MGPRKCRSCRTPTVGILRAAEVPRYRFDGDAAVAPRIKTLSCSRSTASTKPAAQREFCSRRADLRGNLETESSEAHPDHRGCADTAVQAAAFSSASTGSPAEWSQQACGERRIDFFEKLKEGHTKTSGRSVSPTGPRGFDGAANIIREAQDRGQIDKLMWQYVRALDTEYADAYAAAFTPDGQFGAGANAIKGREALKEMIADLRQRTPENETKNGEKGRPCTM